MIVLFNITCGSQSVQDILNSSTTEPAVTAGAPFASGAHTDSRSVTTGPATERMLVHVCSLNAFHQILEEKLHFSISFLESTPNNNNDDDRKASFASMFSSEGLWVNTHLNPDACAQFNRKHR